MLKRNPELYDALIAIRAYSAISDKAKSAGRPFECSCQSFVERLVESKSPIDEVEYPFLEAELFLTELRGEEFEIQVFNPILFALRDEEELSEFFDVIGEWDDAEASELIENARWAYGMREFASASMPEDVNLLMVELACTDRNEETVADQSCGWPSLLLKARKRLSAPHIYLQDISEQVVRRAILLSIIEGISPAEVSAHVGNLIAEDGFPDKKFNIQVSQPPFSLRIDKGLSEKTKEDPRFTSYGALPPSNHEDFYFIENAVFHMKPENGRAVVMCAPSIMGKGSANDQIREELVRKNIVETVIKIPSGTIYETMIATYLLVLDAGKRKTDILLKNAQGGPLMSREKKGTKNIACKCDKVIFYRLK